MSFIGCVIKNYRSILRSSCEDNGCKLSLKRTKKIAITKPDQLMKNEEACDNLIFWIKESVLRICVIEYKEYNPQATKIQHQLMGGCELIKQILEKCKKGDLAIVFFPIAVAKRWKKPELEYLKRHKICFNGNNYDIIRAKDGDSLDEIVNNY